MSVSTRVVVVEAAMGPRIVPDKEGSTLKHWRIDDDNTEGVDEIVVRTGRSETNVVNLLLRWSIQQERANIAAAEPEASAKMKSGKSR